MAQPGMDITRGCWIDLLESPRFAGKLRRLFGPALYANLRTTGREHTGREHTVRVGSLVVGPTAFVQLFRQLHPEAAGVWLLPNQAVSDLSEMKSARNFDSIRIYDRPPFSQEPGYQAFMRHIAKHKPYALPPRKSRKNGKR